jgi:hypothetical protein
MIEKLDTIIGERDHSHIEFVSKINEIIDYVNRLEGGFKTANEELKELLPEIKE